MVCGFKPISPYDNHEHVVGSQAHAKHYADRLLAKPMATTQLLVEDCLPFSKPSYIRHLALSQGSHNSLSLKTARESSFAYWYAMVFGFKPIRPYDSHLYACRFKLWNCHTFTCHIQWDIGT